MSHATSQGQNPVPSEFDTRLRWKQQTSQLVPKSAFPPPFPIPLFICLIISHFESSIVADSPLSLVSCSAMGLLPRSPMYISVNLSACGHFVTVWVRTKQQSQWEWSPRSLWCWRSRVKHCLRDVRSKLDWGWSWTETSAPKGHT